MPTTRSLPSYAAIALAIIGVLCIAVAIVYFAEPAKSLPSFYPGHQAGSNHHHTAHGIVALIVGLVGLVGAWIGAGKLKS